MTGALSPFLAIAIITIGATTEVTLVTAAELPLDVSIRQLVADPGAYNHRLIRVTGVVSHGFEDFTLTDATQPASDPIWLEYGGLIASHTIYCCGVAAGARRASVLTIDNIRIPLKKDQQFRRFDRLLKGSAEVEVRATLIGRFFAGVRTSGPNGDAWTGYGHLGCCSLFAIQQVVSVEPVERSSKASRN